MTLKNKTSDLMKARWNRQWTKEKVEGKEYVGYVLEIRTVFIFISEEYSYQTKARFFEAKIKWCSGDQDMATKTFPATWDGLQQACEWLDEQRIRFIETLL